MAWNPYPPLPVEALRDLLGITRALYRAGRDDAPGDLERLRKLERVGKTLRAVLQASGAAPGTSTHVEAWAAAERAVRELREVAAEALPLVEAMARLVTRPGSMT